jgi:hypothetical protein
MSSCLCVETHIIYTSNPLKLVAFFIPAVFSARSSAIVLISYPYTSKPRSLTYLATGSPNCPSPITRILLNLIVLRVSSKICAATKTLDLCL